MHARHALLNQDKNDVQPDGHLGDANIIRFKTTMGVYFPDAH